MVVTETTFSEWYLWMLLNHFVDHITCEEASIACDKAQALEV